MAECTKIRRKSERVCIGSLNRKILLLSRSIATPKGGSINFGETFTLSSTVWADIKTKNGTQIFDDVNVDRSHTHDVFIRYIEGLTSETWITLPSVTGGKNVRLDILEIINLQEENRFMKLVCSLIGDDTKAANSA